MVRLFLIPLELVVNAVVGGLLLFNIIFLDITSIRSFSFQFL